MGDQVLYDDSLRYYGKLEPKQIGLWTVIEVMYNRLYKVTDYVGVRAQLINSNHLKLYQKRDDS